MRESLANRLATFLEAATGDLAYLALHDQLTGLCNRRHIDELLRRELAYGTGRDPVYLLVYDIDLFKNVDAALCKAKRAGRNRVELE